MRKKLLVFDVYGTLLDIHTIDGDPDVWEIVKKLIILKTEKDLELSSVQLRDLFFSLRSRCVEQMKEEQAKLVSSSIEFIEYDEMMIFGRLLEALEIDGNELLIRQIAKTCRISATRRLSIYPDVKETLARLRESGYKLAILSNAQEIYAREDAGELWEYFDYVYISSEYGIKKPSLSFYRMLLGKAHVEPEEAAMIGNSIIDDMVPAKKLGMFTVYMDSKVLAEPVFQEADAVIDEEHFGSLLKLFV